MSRRRNPNHTYPDKTGWSGSRLSRTSLVDVRVDFLPAVRETRMALDVVPSDAPDLSPAGITASHRRMLLSCFLGTTIEWYDFLIYGLLAPLAFDQRFFPRLSPAAGTIAVFSVFAVGFAARPLGG